ncbi:MAG: hypothetical protein HRU69_13045 [Flammeovirgaceae bacterium]|nr:MAG: hypothetical protein HRU69_13045 [Flammeovirgaceae bacterium]
MASENELRLLDDYLANRLTGQDKTAFEQQLQGSPELQQELRFQQELIQGIRQARVTELKAMLNNVPVPPAHVGTASVAKIISAIAVVGVVSTALYYYFVNKDNEQPQVNKKEATNVGPVTPAGTESISQDPAAGNTDEGAVNTKPAEKPVVSESTAPAVQPKLEVYSPEDEADQLQLQKEQAQLEIISKAFVTSSIEVATEEGTRKHGFHYMFKDNKLVLFGSFDDNLYEILEFIAGDQRTVVLYYNSAYYLLDLDKSVPTPLVPIKDKALLNKLKQYRGN